MADDNNPAASNHPQPGGPPSRSKEETARLGDEIYESHIRHQVEADHHGEVVAIDVETGSWAIAEDEVAATDRLLYQYPDGRDIWCLRVGYRSLYSFGGGILRNAQ